LYQRRGLLLVAEPPGAQRKASEKYLFLFLSFSGRCPETRSLFAKREAKTFITILRILIQSTETIVSAGYDFAV
jgi:hypothetical protein